MVNPKDNPETMIEANVLDIGEGGKTWRIYFTNPNGAVGSCTVDADTKLGATATFLDAQDDSNGWTVDKVEEASIGNINHPKLEDEEVQ